MPSRLIEAIVSTKDKRFWYDPFVHPRAAERRQTEVLNLMLAHGLITAARARHAELTLMQEITNTGS